MRAGKGGRVTCGISVPTRVRKLGSGGIKGVLARAAGKVARFGEQLAVLAFTRSFSTALPENAELLCV
jgi:hypothetical protein